MGVMDQEVVAVGSVGREVYIEIAESDFRIDPEQAREMAFALMMAADQAEHG